MNKPNFKDEMNRRKCKIEYKELNEEIKPALHNKKFFLRTYGCQMNVHDSEQIRYYLEALGMQEVDTLEDSDVVILNTCAVR
jgi:tRNA-2-methylthio-N6-dimethylallyladenosine synthase